MDNELPRVRWKDLSGQERYQVIALMRKGQVEIKQLCRSFGVSRQTLYRAAEAADKASIAALTRKPRGRKRQPASETQLKDLQTQKKKLEKELNQMSQRYEIAQTLLDLQRQAERGELLPGEKKTLRSPGRTNPQGFLAHRRRSPLASGDDGPDSGCQSGGSAQLADSSAEDTDG